MSTRSRNKAVDGVKIICAALVVFLHTINIGTPYAETWKNMTDSVLHVITWAANPVGFFFVIAAYFLFRSSSGVLNKDKLKKYIKRLTILYSFWSIFYINNIFSSFAGIGGGGYKPKRNYSCAT